MATLRDLCLSASRPRSTPRSHRARWPRRKRPCCCPRSRSRGRNRPSTATTPPTLRSSSPASCASRRATSPRPWSGTGGQRGRSAHHPRRGGRPGLRQPLAGAGPRRGGRRRRSARPARQLRPHADRAPAQDQRRVRLGQPDRPADRRQRARRVRRRSAHAACSRRPATRSRASTTSTTRAARSSGSASPCWPCARASRSPDDGYHGDYVKDLAAALPADIEAKALADEADRAGWIVGEWASEQIRAGIERSLENLGVHFDVWKSEGSLHTEGWVTKGIDQLREAGQHVRAGRRAVVQLDRLSATTRTASSSAPTASRPTSRSDIGYVVEKFSRGFDELIYVWGADHHGTIARLQERGRGAGLRPRQRSIVLLDRLGALRGRRRGGCRCPSAPASSRPSTTCWTRSASTPRAGSSPRARRRRASTSTSSWRASSRARTRSTTSSTPTPGSARSCARQPTKD